jgi:hypothetical protein
MSSKLPLGVIRKLFKNAKRWSLGESGMSFSSAETLSREKPRMPTRFGFPLGFASDEFVRKSELSWPLTLECSLEFGTLSDQRMVATML